MSRRSAIIAALLAYRLTVALEVQRCVRAGLIVGRVRSDLGGKPYCRLTAMTTTLGSNSPGTSS
jgi:hypothetical protein